MAEGRGGPRLLRLLVFFDLPVTTQEAKRNYVRFRRFLLEDGYDMLQFSVYCRIVNGEDAVSKHLERLAHNLPPQGSVRFLQVTDRQYARMKLLVGERTRQEKKVPACQMLLF
ncbi:CRISPR-associated endonuclease Cas2 [Aminomonas paucivorans]|uniref:CRISPR-associated endonuclease Cas2 n=1 Tax=Aminomonas paucivorans TaxID=81412 RepID=UPI00331C615B